MSDGVFSEAHPLTCLIGMALEELRAELGAPDVEQRHGDGVWLVFDLPAFELRVRCSDEPQPVADSCSVSLRVGRPTLAEATRSLGLWPACGPDEAADSADPPLVRRGLSHPRGGVVSMTATIRNGAFTRVTVFDEEPEWEG